MHRATTNREMIRDALTEETVEELSYVSGPTQEFAIVYLIVLVMSKNRVISEDDMQNTSTSEEQGHEKTFDRNRTEYSL